MPETNAPIRPRESGRKEGGEGREGGGDSRGGKVRGGRETDAEANIDSIGEEESLARL